MLPFFKGGQDVRDSYKRIHGDSGQHRRILWMALVLGVLGFIPMIARLYDLMVTHYDLS